MIKCNCFYKAFNFVIFLLAFHFLLIDGVFFDTVG